MQRVLIMWTHRGGLRDKAFDWSFEDANHVIPSAKRNGFDRLDIPTSLIGARAGNQYQTVLHALGDGWKLLAPPQHHDKESESITYQWWLTKDNG